MSTPAARPQTTPVGVRRDPWVALEVGADPRRWARTLRRVHASVVSGGAPPPELRTTIAASWRRSAAGGAPPVGNGAPDALDHDALAERRDRHPLAAALPAIRRVLHAGMGESHHIMVVSDADAVLLWVEGPAREISRAVDDMNFVPGSDWSESAVGTNSIGTALAADHPIQVFSAEHYNVACHRWTCSGAPVHDPVTGRLVGAIDITSDYATYHPSGHPLVVAAAQVAESVLAAERQRRDRRLVEAYLAVAQRMGRRPTAVAAPDGEVLLAVPAGWIGRHVGPLAPGEVPRLGLVAQPLLDGDGYLLTAAAGDAAGPAATEADRPLTITALGRRRARCQVQGRTVDLSPRHSEILVLLALHPEGLTGDDLIAMVYDGAASDVTVRAEIARLRNVLGDVIAARPYRLRPAVTADFLSVAPDPALTLLIGSTAPGILAARRRTHRT